MLELKASAKSLSVTSSSTIQSSVNVYPSPVAQRGRWLLPKQIPHSSSYRFPIAHDPVPDGSWRDAQLVDGGSCLAMPAGPRSIEAGLSTSG